ncbi:hypothetical protein [Niveispirillum sp. KHB5.9]|uniref:hypothetical protein n=1 Tax=Niveispirillum sp. KHB5.9 TaxID=3400269 RepID=UPI003A897D4F
MSMDMEMLERAWAGAANKPEKAAGLYLIDSLMGEVARQRRDFRLRMGLVGVALGGWSLVALYSIAWRGVVDPVREWGALLMLAIAWGVYGLVVRRGYDGAADAPGPSLPGNLRALLAQNEAALRRVRIMAVAVPLFLAALALAVMQLGDVDKMSARNIRDFALLAGVGFTIATGIHAWRYHRMMKPESQRLRRLLGQYEEVA